MSNIYRMFQIAAIATLFASCSAPPQNTPAEIVKEAVKIETFNMESASAWKVFYELDASLNSSKREVSQRENGVTCENATGLGGEVSICNFGGKVVEISYRQFPKTNENSDAFAKAMISIFALQDMPYTERDKARIIREFRDYSTEKAPLKFAERWIAINGSFVKINRLIGPSKSGFEAQSIAGIDPAS